MKLEDFKAKVNKQHENYITNLKDYCSRLLLNNLILDICNVVYKYCELDYVAIDFDEKSKLDETRSAKGHREGYKLYDNWHLIVLHTNTTPSNWNYTIAILTNYNNGIKNGLEGESGGVEGYQIERLYDQDTQIFEKYINYYHEDIELYYEERFDPKTNTKYEYQDHSTSRYRDGTPRAYKSLIISKDDIEVDKIKHYCDYMSDYNFKKLVHFDIYKDLFETHEYDCGIYGHQSLLDDLLKTLGIRKSIF